MVLRLLQAPRAAGGRSTAPTWSPWSGPAPGSRPAGWSNAPASLSRGWRH